MLRANRTRALIFHLNESPHYNDRRKSQTESDSGAAEALLNFKYENRVLGKKICLAFNCRPLTEAII